MHPKHLPSLFKYPILLSTYPFVIHPQYLAVFTYPIPIPPFHIHRAIHLLSCGRHIHHHFLSKHGPSRTNSVQRLLFTAIITSLILPLSLLSSRRSLRPRLPSIVNCRSSHSHSSSVTSIVQVLPFPIPLMALFVIFSIAKVPIAPVFLRLLYVLVDIKRSLIDLRPSCSMLPHVRYVHSLHYPNLTSLQ